MKVLVIDSDGSSLDFCLRAKEAGHDVRLFVCSKKGGEQRCVGEGLVHRIDNWRGSMSWADLVFLTGNDRYMNELEPFKKRGFPIFSPGVQGARLEIDRAFGQKILKMAGIPVIPYTEFTDYDGAMKFVAKNEQRYVSKTLGDEEDKSLSYVSKSPEDMIYMLDRWKRLGKNIGRFMLQEFVPGVEVGVSGWFGPGGWSEYKNENFEHKKLMNGDKGVNTGEMGTVMKYVKDSKLFKDALEPVTDYLHSIEYVGDIDMNCMVDFKGTAWPLEFTCRPGWPAFRIMQSCHKGDPVQWMVDLIKGENTLKVNTDVAIGVVMAQPDFPYSNATGKEVTGIPVFGLDDVPRNQISPADMMMGKVASLKNGRVTQIDMPVTCGDYVIVCTGTGSTVSKAKEAAYKVVDKISFPNSPMYRTDIGDRLEKQLPLLQKHGYATEFVY